MFRLFPMHTSCRRCHEEQQVEDACATSASGEVTGLWLEEVIAGKPLCFTLGAALMFPHPSFGRVPEQRLHESTRYLRAA